MTEATGERASLGLGARDVRGAAPSVMRAHAVTEQTLYVDAVMRGFNAQAAAEISRLMARRVPEAKVRRMTADQVRTAAQAGDARMQRRVAQVGGADVAAAVASGATPDAAVRQINQLQTRAVTAAELSRVAQQQGAAQLAAANAPVHESTLPQPAQALVRPVVAVQGVNRGTTPEVLGDGSVVRQFGYTGSAQGKQIDTHATEVPSSPVAMSVTTAAPVFSSRVMSAEEIIRQGGVPAQQAAQPQQQRGNAEVKSDIAGIHMITGAGIAAAAVTGGAAAVAAAAPLAIASTVAAVAVGRFADRGLG